MISWSEITLFCIKQVKDKAWQWCHISVMVSQITSITTLCWTACSSWHQCHETMLFILCLSMFLPKLPINGPLWGESTHHRWIPLTKGQYSREHFHVMSTSYINHRASLNSQNIPYISPLHRNLMVIRMTAFIITGNVEGHHDDRSVSVL